MHIAKDKHRAIHPRVHFFLRRYHQSWSMRVQWCLFHKRHLQAITTSTLRTHERSLPRPLMLWQFHPGAKIQQCWDRPGGKLYSRSCLNSGFKDWQLNLLMKYFKLRSRIRSRSSPDCLSICPSVCLQLFGPYGGHVWTILWPLFCYFHCIFAYNC